MRYLALACDYDGTLATAGRVADSTITALERLLASGRKLILVTGRELEDLLRVFPRCDLFEWVVAENGCLLYRPATQEQLLLYEPPPITFIEALRARGVPFAVGKVICASWVPHEGAVLEAIRECGLDLQVIFNKGAVMIVPAGHNKASGLTAALDKMALSPHNVAGIGDAENDHAFLELCACAVSVANGLPMVQEKADFVTTGEEGQGVAELAGEVVASDFAERDILADSAKSAGDFAPAELEAALRRAEETLAAAEGIEAKDAAQYILDGWKNLMLEAAQTGGVTPH
jgi:hydroxymethylpyrimidine pyrophosphatase-like HAD family hydrolase